MSTHLRSLARRALSPQIPVFPLKGTVLLPGCELPLNIFEPRYLNMVDDALRGDRIIGIIQPALQELDGVDSLAKNTEPHVRTQSLSKVGTLGRIKQYSETDDGRYLISLIGLKRFTVSTHADVTTPYRQAMVSYDGFEADPDVFSKQTLPQAMTESAPKRAALIAAMKSFASALGIELDWAALKSIPIGHLVDQSTMISPFNPADKQSLLECSTPARRLQLVTGLMNLYSETNNPNDASKHKDRDIQ